LTPVSTGNRFKMIVLLVEIIPFYCFQSAYFREACGFFRGDYVEYHTVWVDEEGIVQFRNDIYGYERKLFR
ncbi:MAG: hypothetical protein PHS85_08960, partial [Sulfurovum sp.]|nr:hypothetical protein [Sulfurovum sp.]